MAPPKHKIWALFREYAPTIRGAKPHPDATCLASKIVLPNAQSSRNLLQHAIKCDKIDEETKERWQRHDAALRHKQAAKLTTPSKHRGPRTPTLTKYLFGTNYRGLILIITESGVTNLALITDGWSNKNGDSIVNFVLVNPRIPPLFWKSINSKADGHTAEYIAGTIWSTILEFESIIGSGKVTSVVTGSAANMKKAWRLVRKQRVNLVCTGCTAHGAQADKCPWRQNCTPTVQMAYLLDQTKTIYDLNDLEVKPLIKDAMQLAQDLQLIPAGLAKKFHKQLQFFVLVKSAWTGKLREDNNAYSPIAWWPFETSKTYALVREFATLLLYIPTSSASSERSWSTHGFIHTKLRNPLTPERVNKLVFVYTNIARKSEVNHIVYQLYPDAHDDSDISDESDEEEDENVASNYQRETATAMTTESEEKEDGDTIREAAVQAQNMFQTPPPS
ncbi:unnamed protein product [Phytophthora fragariaefolia]|uniref:Unnamed protein product n=1 Tax=Phytophthora fragariaefolia TaxID=1490495 RepID=A0A9W6XNC0_9STRA|nr:unnamed protein product [Phytophthora fragariaefolia]